MGKWVLVVESDCKDPGSEDDFNDWYNNVHLPDVFETPCFVKASRYELTEPSEGKARYLTIYEIESDDIDDDMAKHSENMKNKTAQGRRSDLFQRASRGMYKEIFSYPG